MSRRILVSGPFRLDLADERLWRDEAPVPLGGKALALLRVLMDTPQTLLTKDELFDRVWPGLAVSESVLTTAVKELRRALGDDARRPTVIETVHGRGYRFLLPVEHVDRTPAAGSPPPAVPTPPLGPPAVDPEQRWFWTVTTIVALGLVIAAIFYMWRLAG